MTYPDESVMAASERLMELIDQRDRQEEERERDDRLAELGPYTHAGHAREEGPYPPGILNAEHSEKVERNRERPEDA